MKIEVDLQFKKFLVRPITLEHSFLGPYIAYFFRLFLYEYAKKKKKSVPFFCFCFFNHVTFFLILFFYVFVFLPYMRFFFKRFVQRFAFCAQEKIENQRNGDWAPKSMSLRNAMFQYVPVWLSESASGRDY